MSLFHVRMELARGPGAPEGNANEGYEFIVPLTADKKVDAAAWRLHKDRCTVIRFAPDDDEYHGHLAHVGQGWKFRYETKEFDEEEPLAHLERHTLAEGEYLTVTGYDEETRTFRIVWVKDSPLG